MSASGDRLRRFERLERARAGLPGGDEPPDAGGRFEGLETGGEPPAGPSVPGAAADRFRPPPDRPPDLAPSADGEQPFLRCARCEADNARHAERCTHCGAELRTDEQRSFNARLWAARREEAAALERENLSRVEAARQADEDAARARREAAALLVREVGRRERERLDREDGRADWPWGVLLAGLGRALRRLLRGP